MRVLILLAPWLSLCLASAYDTLAPRLGQPVHGLQILQRRQRSFVDESLRVLAIGDSITEGFRSSLGNGFRLYLYDDLHAAGFKSVEFIGTQSFGNNTGPSNHCEGYGGFRISEIRQKVLRNCILLQRPNVVLLQAGTNDVIQDASPPESAAAAPSRLEKFIKDIACVCPDAAIFVAKIPQLGYPISPSAHERGNAFNAAIPAVVARLVAKGYKVGLVDNSNLAGSALLFDGIHPNDEGYALMAQHWLQAIQEARKGWIQPPTNGGGNLINAINSGCVNQAAAACSQIDCGESIQCRWRCLNVRIAVESGLFAGVSLPFGKGGQSI